MSAIEELTAQLTDKNTVRACGAAEKLVGLSGESGAVYAQVGYFFELLDSDNSYVRNRAAALIAANARWDGSGIIGESLDRLLAHITDEKPITARKTIEALGVIAAARPELAERIRAALKSADTSRYADSMRPLVELDMAKLIRQIDETEAQTDRNEGESIALTR